MGMFRISIAQKGRRLKMDSPTDAIEQVRLRVLPDNRLDRRNAAKALARTPKTLAEWKCKGIGPRPINVGGRVFYDFNEVMQMARGEKPITPAALAVA